MNEAVTQFVEVVEAKPPEAYYDAGRKEYLVKDKRGDWLGLTETQFKRVLRHFGITAAPDRATGISPQDNAIMELQMDRNVAWAGQLAGWKAGYYEVAGTRILVTGSPRIIEPVEGDWAMLRGIIEGVLGYRGGEQLPYVYAWLKVAYEALRVGKRQPGQVFVMCGPHGCGKSLIQQIITQVVGGRVARPFQTMTGGTSFNSDLFCAEHLSVEDECPSHEIRARRAFGAAIKNVTVNSDQRLHQKHRDAIILQPFWRMSVSLNDEAENVMILPPMDDSIEDKLMVFRATRYQMPMPTGTADQRAALWSEIIRQLPAMLNHLVGMEIPADLRCERFGVRHYHNPDIRQVLNDVAPEYRLLALIDASHFAQILGPLAGAVRPITEDWVATAESIQARLTEANAEHAHEARQLLSWANACGTYLGRLARDKPDRVRQERTADARQWRITRPPGAAAIGEAA